MADVETIDAAYSSLQAQANQTVAAIRALSTKLQAATADGNPSAREWNLDLREVALALQEEQQEASAVLQAMHDFVVNNAHQPIASAPPYAQPPAQQPQYQQPPAQQPQYQQEAPHRGGLLSRFMSGGLGRSIAQGAGLGIGFGVGESIIDDIF